MSEFAETLKREADSENKEEVSATKKSRIESSEDNASKEVSFRIDADAAEDKGLRQTMEDEWVVLLDAARDYPGSLRFSCFWIILHIVISPMFADMFKWYIAMRGTCMCTKCLIEFLQCYIVC